MGIYREFSDVSKYEQIAFDLAGRIANNQYPEGSKLFGRSTLAGQYGVSPETVRRSVALLQSMGIVDVVMGRGIHVLSREKAKQYLEKYNQRKGLLQAQRELSDLIAERRELDLALENQIKKILSYSSRIVNILPKVEELKIGPDSPFKGKTLKEINLREATGATVLVVERKGEEYISPSTEMRIEENDILIYIAPEGSRMFIEEYSKSDNKTDNEIVG